MASWAVILFLSTDKQLLTVIRLKEGGKTSVFDLAVLNQHSIVAARPITGHSCLRAV